MPDGGARKPVDLLTPIAAAARAVSAMRIRRPPPHALGIAVTVDVRGQDPAMAFVDRVADGLTYEVCAERPHAEALFLQQSPHRFAYPGSATALSTSKWSPQQASSSPSYPQVATLGTSSASGRSAHWPVNSVTGRPKQPSSMIVVARRC